MLRWFKDATKLRMLALGHDLHPDNTSRDAAINALRAPAECASGGVAGQRPEKLRRRRVPLLAGQSIAVPDRRWAPIAVQSRSGRPTT